jgi:hypothetical protein
MTLSASARAEVLFDSLSSQNSRAVTSPLSGASFDTGASAFRLTDVALLLDATSFHQGDTFTVMLGGGIPLADIKLVKAFGLNVNSNGGPILDSVTLPTSDLSARLTVQHFSQFANLTLAPNAFYAISIVFTQGEEAIGWGTTTEDSGPGVADGYNSSYLTNDGFFPNKPTPPPNNGGPIFQMEVSGVATPEPSTWALMLVGLAGLGLFAHRRQPALASKSAPSSLSRRR